MRCTIQERDEELDVIRSSNAPVFDWGDDEEDKYLLHFQVKSSVIYADGSVHFHAPYPGFRETYAEKVHALVFVVGDCYFVYPLGSIFGSVEVSGINLDPQHLNRDFQKFKVAFSEANLAFDESNFPHYIKNMINTLKQYK